MVPPYPQAQRAAEIGEKLKEKYGIEFFFPSPTLPEDDCPRWLERDQAIRCGDCGILIIPTDSKYLPKDICYNCHLTRESNRKFIEDEPGYTSLAKFFERDQELKFHNATNSYSSDELLNVILEVHGLEEEEVVEDGILKVDTSELIPVRDRLEDLIDTWLPEYMPVDGARWARWKEQGVVLKYKGKEYKFLLLIDPRSEKARSWIPSYHSVNQAIDRGEQLLLVFGQGLTYRDAEMIRYIRRQVFIPEYLTPSFRASDPLCG